MSKTINTTFRRLALAGLVAASFVGSAQAAPCYFGECDSARPVQQTAAASKFTVLAKHGTWTVLGDGKATIILDRFDDGAEFAIARNGDGEFGFVWHSKTWRWQTGQTFPVKIDIDGHVLNGTAKATSSDIIIATGVTKEAIKEFYGARKVKMQVAGETFTEDSLVDAVASIDDAARYLKTSSR